MKYCCDSKIEALSALRKKQSSVLKIVLVINFAMFFVEMGAGLIAGSSALIADSLDMLGDASVYAFSLYVIDLGKVWQIRAALLKGAIMAMFAVFTTGKIVHEWITGTIPVAETMGVIGFAALFANLICLLLLYRHRSDDINMSSTWICSRNDVFSNAGVLLASYFVLKTNSNWPDILIGGIIAFVFAISAFEVLREALKLQQKTR